MPRIVMPIVDGSRYRPETTTDAPKPKPVLLGSCANCGSTMNDEYIPAPSRKAARFVVQTPRMRIIVMSISGFELRTSTGTHSTVTAMPTASSASVLAEPQPQLVVSEMASSTIEMPIVISAAASPLILPGLRTG